jgi:AraC-like DNA-binding protein/tetratricopeptide (TPR) repeat protein
MPPYALPRDVKRAVELLCAQLDRPWRVDELARQCNVPRRTLEKHFRHFVGCAPLQFLHTERLGEARRQLLMTPIGANVTSIAANCGFNHLGRFALAYRDRYGESPSDTLKWRRLRHSATIPLRLAGSAERPTLAVLPFDPVLPPHSRSVDIGAEIAAALHRTGWPKIVLPPHGRYHLHGRVTDDGAGTLLIRVTLLDRSTSRLVWTERFERAGDDLSGSVDWVCSSIATAVWSVMSNAEIDQATEKEPTELSAWGLSMRALPMVLAADPGVHGTAIELLQRAIELAPRDPLPLSLAAWCHGLRAGHHFTARPHVERERVRQLSLQASALGIDDPVSNTMLSAAGMLAHDLAGAEHHARRALRIDGGSAWGWGRLGWVHAYRGETTKAIECCKMARGLAPFDPLSFVWSIGIAAANVEAGRYNRGVQWYLRALSEQPKAIWINRFLAPVLVLAGDKDEGRARLRSLYKRFPGLTISEVRAGLPHTAKLLDPLSEGLASLGMPYS